MTQGGYNGAVPLGLQLRWEVHAARSTCRSISSAVSMRGSILAAVLLGLVLTPALAGHYQKVEESKKISIGGGFQIMTINRDWLVASIEQRSNYGSWKTLWNYDTGFLATKVLPERSCYISIMNRTEMPKFDALPQLAAESRNQNRHRPPTKEILFTLVRRNVRDLESYGPDTFSLCRGLTTYVAYEVQGPQLSHRPCTTLDVLQHLALTYCHDSNYV
ncbi:gastrokine-1 [Pithys albifrons albifrons]|uniref:gastrokine-1 n=1 Tax=Pithys albifrons albifrons TaxID=3385563 RepID=UPI003A5D093B